MGLGTRLPSAFVLLDESKRDSKVGTSAYRQYELTHDSQVFVLLNLHFV